MNRKQRASIGTGLFLLVLSLLFAPTHPYRTPLVSYSFLFTGQGQIDFARLLVEWLLIALLTGALFLILSKSKNSATEDRNESSAAVPKKGHVLLLLTATLAALVVCLSILSYREIKKVRRLEAGIQAVIHIVDTELPRPVKDVPPAPVGPLYPLKEWVQSPALATAIQRKNEALRNARTELENMN